MGEQGIDQLQQVVDSLPGKATTLLQSAVDKVKDELKNMEKKKRLNEPSAGFDKLFK